MIDGLTPYPNYKDSGEHWLGKIPDGWSVQRAKNLFRLRVEKSGVSHGRELLSVYTHIGVRPRKELEERGNKATTTDDYWIVKRGDIVVNKLLAWMGAVGVSHYDGVTSPAYDILRPIQRLDMDYYHQLFRTNLYLQQFKIRSRGIMEMRLRLYFDELGQIPTIAPPLEDQSTIVQFLDHADVRFKRFIKAKRRLIALLNEQKQAIIRRAVTRGLNPQVHLKPSGVSWLGDVPQHWALSRVKTEFACLNRHRVPLSSIERGAMTSRTYDYYGASGVIDKVDGFLFEDELLLIAEDGANLVLRNLPLAIIARGRFWVNNHAHILKPRRGNIEYFAQLMQTLNYLPWISGAAQPKLTQDRLMAIAIAVPPPDEQQQIVEATRSETSSLTATIEKTQRELELVREYRVRLIADVVTGKLDVREAAARLPDAADEQDVLADTDLLADDGLGIDEMEVDAVPEEVDA